MRMDVWMEGPDAPVGLLARSEDKILSFAYADDIGPEHRISMSDCPGWRRRRTKADG